MSGTGCDTIVMTADIDSKIINIIQNAGSYCYIISPSLFLWPLLEREFEKAIGSKKTINVIAEKTTDAKQLSVFKLLTEKYKVSVFLVENLHFSLFFNEKESFFSSMAVHDNSQENTFELGVYSAQPNVSLKLKTKVVEEELLKFGVQFNSASKAEEIEEDPLVKEMSTISSDVDMGYDNNADEDEAPVEMPW